MFDLIKIERGEREKKEFKDLILILIPFLWNSFFFSLSSFETKQKKKTFFFIYHKLSIQFFVLSLQNKKK